MEKGTRPDRLLMAGLCSAVQCAALRCVALRSGRAGAVQQLQIATGAVDGSEAQGLTMRKVAAEAGCFSQISF